MKRPNRFSATYIAMSIIGPFFALWVGSAITAHAESIQHKTKMDVRFGIIPVGRATFKITFDDETYSLRASGKTVGVADMVAPGKGWAKSQGRIVDGRIEAVQHEAVFIEEKKKKSTLEMEFENGAVTKVSVVPEKRKKKKSRKWVQILEEQLSAVIDPASTIIVPVVPEEVGNPRAVCNRVLNIYDGETRFDMKLKYKFTKTIKTEGYEGNAFVCQLRYVPVSGHKKNQRNIEYMRDNEGMEIWLAPLEKSNFYSPIRIEVPTWVGQFTAIPTYFGLSAQ